MNNINTGIFKNIYRPLYIAKKFKIEYDDYNNEIIKYDKPKFMGKFNYQPLAGDELNAYMSVYGETKNKLIRLFLDIKYINEFKEFDLAYLYEASPKSEEINGEYANYSVKTFAPQNTKILVVFEEIIKEEN
jgi:hypothetical protein